MKVVGGISNPHHYHVTCKFLMNDYKFHDVLFAVIGQLFSIGGGGGGA